MSWQRVPELDPGAVWVVDTELTRYHLDRCATVRAAEHAGTLLVWEISGPGDLAGRVLCGVCAVVYGHTPPTPLPTNTPHPPAAQHPPTPLPDEGGRG